MLIMFTLEAALHAKPNKRENDPRHYIQRNIPHKHLEASSRGVKVKNI
jgi:hypothetical protein